MPNPPDSPPASTPSVNGARRQRVTVRRSTADGAISAAVDLDGRIVDLHLDPAVLTRTAVELAEDILGCVRAAQEALG